MVHKSSIVPGISSFIDENILSHYPPTSMKRILMASAATLMLKQNENVVDTLTSSPLVSGLGVVHSDGQIDIDTICDVLRREIQKSGFMRVTVPFVGDIDFTSDDVDSLHRFITEANTRNASIPAQINSPVPNANIGVY